MRHHEPGFDDFREDAKCTIRPQSLIGEKLRRVHADPAAPRRASAPPPPLREIPEGEPGEGQHLLPVERTSKPVDLDLINNITRLPQRQRLAIILNELGAGVAGRARGPQRDDPPREPGARRDERGPRDPRRAEPGPARASRPTPTRCSRRSRATASSVASFIENAEHRLAGDRRAPRRPRAQLRAAAALPRGAAPDDDAPRRLRRRVRAGAHATCRPPRRTSTACSASSARSARPASRRSSRSARPPTSAARRSSQSKPIVDDLARPDRARPRRSPKNLAELTDEPARHRRHRAADGLPLLPGRPRSTASTSSATTCAPA